MRNLTLFSLATLLAIAPIAHGQSADFILSQHGKAVGTASFNFKATSDGYDSAALVRINMQGLNYSLSKTEQLTQANQLRGVQLNAAVNNAAVNVTAAPEENPAAPILVLKISANGQQTSTRLATHPAAVFLPDFDPGALETLLSLTVAHNSRDLWAIIPKKAGSVAPVQVATLADEKGTLDGNPIVVHHLEATIGKEVTDLFSGPENQLLQAELPQPGFAMVRKGFVLTPPSKPGAPPPPPPAQSDAPAEPSPAN
jgi:hypothetical protein